MKTADGMKRKRGEQVYGVFFWGVEALTVYDGFAQRKPRKKHPYADIMWLPLERTYARKHNADLNFEATNVRDKEKTALLGHLERGVGDLRNPTEADRGGEQEAHTC